MAENTQTETAMEPQTPTERAVSKIERELSRSVQVKDVAVVSDPGLYPEGANSSDTDEVLCIDVRHPSNDPVFGDLSRGGAEMALRAHVEDELFSVDGRLAKVSFPARRSNNQTCYFYVAAAL